MRSLVITLIFGMLLSSNFIYSQKLDYVQGDILIQLEDNISIVQIKRTFDLRYDLDYDLVTSLPFLIYKLRFDFTEFDEYEILKSLKNDKRIRYAQFNHLIEERVIPNDPGFSNQWQYLQEVGSNGMNADLDADLAWNITTGGLTVNGDTIVACVIDDGIIDNHEDFGDNLWVNHMEIPGNNIDDDNNGYIDDYLGWDTYSNNGNIHTDGSHGTPVAGIVGAQGNNGIGVTGVNWDIKLMIVRGGGNEANALASYAYPYYFRQLYNQTDGAQGAFVVATNASWGTNFGNPDDAPIWCNFYDALGEEGILSCGATANLNINVDSEGDLPTGCSSEYLISVTNMDRNDEKVIGAGYGVNSIDLGAFGEETWTTNWNNNYSPFGGTSGATPHVTGAIALLYSAPCSSFADLALQDPALAATLGRQYILDGVEPNESLLGITATGGRLNLNNSILNLMTNCSGCPISTNIEFTDLDLDGFTVNWVDTDENTETNLRFRSELDADWTIIENVTSPFEITDIDRCAQYTVELQSICDTISNVFFGNYQLETEGCCAFGEEQFLNITEVSAFEISLTIPTVLAADNARFEYKSVTSSDWISIEIETGETIIIDGLEECTRYQFRSQLECGGTLSNYYNFDNFTTSCSECSDLEYCEIPFVNAGFEWIEEVSFLKDTFNTGQGAGSNENFLGIKTFNFRQDQYVDLHLTPGFAQSTFDEYWKVWIDYDKNGVFNDGVELVYQSEGLSDTTNVGEFRVPFDTELGLTRMRIVMSFDAPSFSCGDANFDFGQSEDYCVYIDESSGVSQTRLFNIDMFPNPTFDELKLRNVFEPGIIEIYSASGQVKFTESIDGIGSYSYSLKHLIDPGVYFVVFTTREGVWSEKLIKI